MRILTDNWISLRSWITISYIPKTLVTFNIQLLDGAHEIHT